MKEDFKSLLAKTQVKVQKLLLKQNTLTAIILGLIGFGIILVLAISQVPEKQIHANPKKEQKIELKLGVDEDLWRGGQEDKLNDANHKLGAAMQDFEEFKKKAEAELSDAKTYNEEIKKSNEELIKKVEWLTSFVEETYMQSKKPENNFSEQVIQEEPKQIKQTKQISIIDVSSKVSDAYVVNTIPANSFVDAVVLEGADISTATSSSGDPKPVLLQITDFEDLPEKFRKNFKNCRVMTSSRAEIGTRRASARLESMTCEYVKTGRRITSKVSGFVVGEDAKEGLRSELIETNQDMLMRSLFGGIAGNLAGGGKNNNPSFIFPAMNAATSSTKAFGEVAMGRLTDGLAAGVETSADRWSKFQLEEAEKRMPFLEMSPGRKVTVVFTEESRLEIGSNKTSSLKKSKATNVVHSDEIDSRTQKDGIFDD